MEGKKQFDINEALEEVTSGIDDVIEYVKEECGSLAAVAALEVAKEAVTTVLEKHEKRDDLWIESLSAFGATEIARTKVERVKALQLSAAMGEHSLSEVLDEMTEEIGDAVAYLGFANWLVINTGKAVR
jgi:hypothetical protein